MSGPTEATDPGPAVAPPGPDGPVLEVTASHRAEVGGLTVHRALPRRARRTVGAWCFADHMGPAQVTESHGVDIGPHPHIGLQTVTWLLSGEILHRDSLGSEQLIRPGQLNLMTAGQGVAHSEEATGRYRGELHGIQLWVAQPDSTRHGRPAFEHHAELPQVELGSASATVLVGTFAGSSSAARRDTDHLGVDLALRAGGAVVPVEAAAEHGLIVLAGAVELDGRRLEPGALAYLGDGREELSLRADAPARALLLGGTPWGEPPLMWWNYVARTRDEVVEAHRHWTDRDPRFGSVASPLPPIDVDPPAWSGRSG